MFGFDIGAMNTSIAFCESRPEDKKLICDVILSDTSSRIIPYINYILKLDLQFHIRNHIEASENRR
jgi:hypothetical protein